MHGLSSDELRGLNKWTDTKLVTAFLRYGDRAYLIALQDAAGVAHKNDGDPDVARLDATYDALKAELEKRLKVQNAALATTLEGHSRAIAHHTAFLHGTLGILDDGKLESEIVQIKADLTTTLALVEAALG